MPLPPEHIIRHFVERLSSIRHTSRLWNISEDELADIVQTEMKISRDEWNQLRLHTEHARLNGASLAIQKNWQEAVMELEQAAVFSTKNIATLEALAEAYRRYWNISHQLAHRNRALQVVEWCLHLAPKNSVALKIQKELEKDTIFAVRMSHWFGHREPFFDFKKWLHELEKNSPIQQLKTTGSSTASDWEIYLQNKIKTETEECELEKRNVFIQKLQLPQNSSDETIFVIALQKIDYEAIKFFAPLVKEKINEPIVNGILPLNYALLRLDVTITDILLKVGANPNHIDLHTGLPLLCLPIEVDNVALVQLLIANNADVNFKKQSLSPISYAIEQGKMTIIRLFIEAGAILDTDELRNPTVKLILQEIAMNRNKK